MTKLAISKADILRRLSLHREVLEGVGVRHLAIFGSRARGDAAEDSDLDTVVDLRTPNSATDDATDPEARRIATARAELAVSGTLSEICGLDVSVIERSRLPADFARRIADDLIEVF